MAEANVITKRMLLNCDGKTTREHRVRLLCVKERM